MVKNINGDQNATENAQSIVTATACNPFPDLDKDGPVTFNCNDLLGIGPGGTYVFKGKFNSRVGRVGRNVAVKFFPAKYSFSDHHEESDEHPNIIRLFYTDEDHYWKYIVLDLCPATVQDYVERKFYVTLKILKGATSGLAHLHSLGIAHGCIKPSNVLLKLNDRGEIRTMLSDFGSCIHWPNMDKELLWFAEMVYNKACWFAPEYRKYESVTCAGDMFSLGLLFSYLFSLSQSKCDEFRIELLIPLIIKLISFNADERPSAAEVLMHSFFWDFRTILEFFKDAFGRLKKATADSPMIQTLEEDALTVVNGNWLKYIDPVVKDDLENPVGSRRAKNGQNAMKYAGETVLDLVRAIRNKWSHFLEISATCQPYYGSSPEQFIIYWLSKFPLLLYRTWLAMEHVKYEPTFKQYYYHPDCKRIEKSSPSTSSSAT